MIKIIEGEETIQKEPIDKLEEIIDRFMEENKLNKYELIGMLEVIKDKKVRK